MSEFHLQIVTPDGLLFDGQAESIVVRTIDGDVGILANHINYVTALGMGEARVKVGGELRRAACIGGMLAVTNKEVRVVATTFEWAEMIDKERADAAEERARKILADTEKGDKEYVLAEAKLKRALVRKSVAR